MKLTSLIYTIILFLATLSNAAEISLIEQPDLEPTPIMIGEVLTYETKIGFFPFSAGKQTLEVVEKTNFLGHSVYHLRSIAKTGSVFSKIYRFRDQKESYITTDKLYPILYTKKIRDRNYRGNYRISFDRRTGRATSIKNRKKKELDVPSGIQDELSMLFFLRSKKLEIGKKYKFPVLISSKVYEVVIHVLRRELRKTAVGKVKMLVLKTSNGYKLWLTDDKFRIPIRIEAETKIGTLKAELEKVER